MLLKAIHDLFQRVLTEEVREREAINSPEALRAYLQLAMRHDAAEHVRVLFLDRKDRLIRDEVQGRGTVDQAPLYPREVVKRALELGASAVIWSTTTRAATPRRRRADIEYDAAGGRGTGAGRHRRPRPSHRRQRSGREPARAGNTRLSPISWPANLSLPSSDSARSPSAVRTILLPEASYLIRGDTFELAGRVDRLWVRLEPC